MDAGYWQALLSSNVEGLHAHDKLTVWSLQGSNRFNPGKVPT